MDNRIVAALDEGHLSLTLNAPDSSNALAPEMVEALIEALNSDGVRSCTITGEGRNFCAGFDLSALAELSDGDLLFRFLRIETFLQAVYHAPFPIMALCHGHVIGAGADLVAACTRRIAAPETKFRLPGWNFELALGTRRLTRLIGSDNARDVLIDTKSFSADEGVALGFVSEIASPEDWPQLIEKFKMRSRVLPEFAIGSMLALTGFDTRAEDMAAIVATAGRPGIKQRILAYGESIAAARRKQTQKG